MYFHPLQEELGNLTEEQITIRIKELSRKVATAKRFMRNPELLGQVTFALESYRTELRNRRIKVWQDEYKKSRGEPELVELINIE